MSDSYEVEHNGIDGEDKMGSLNHGIAQTKLSYLLLRENKNLTVITELSLDISQYNLSKYRLESKYEIKPDICAYLEPPIIPDMEDDLITVSKMPDLVIEILSPRQAMSYLTRKIKAFFELGAQSCWLVNPSMRIITVYSQPNQHETFVSNKDVQVIDKVMNIYLPIKEIFL